MPTVKAFRLFAVDLPFRTAFRHAAAERRTSESLFLKAVLDDGAQGWGETLPRSYVSGESRQGSFDLLRETILPPLVGHSFGSLEDVTSFLEECDGKAPPGWVDPSVPQSSAWCAVDLALTDALGRASGEAWMSGHARSGGAGGEVSDRYSGVVSADRAGRFVVSLLKMRAFRFPHVKLKVGSEGAAQVAHRARRILGKRVDLRVDANMAWSAQQALGIIAELRRSGIAWVEQPIAAGDLDGLALLVRDSSAGIVVDEGLTDRGSLRALIDHRAASGVNVRISKCGGLVAAYARCREALDAGLMLQVGCQVGESSLLSAAHVSLLSALAPLTPGVRYAEGCFGRHLLREDPVSPSIRFRYGGRAPKLPTGAGSGVQVDERMLGRWTVDEAHVSS